MKISKKILIGSLIFLLGSISGVFTFRIFTLYRPEPFYSILQKISKKYISVTFKDDNRWVDPSYEFNPYELISVNEKSKIKLIRSELKSYLFNEFKYTSKLPIIEENIYDDRFLSIDNLSSIDKLKIELDYKLNSIGYHFKPIKSNKKFVIYHQGHAGGFIKGINYINFFLGKGYEVIALAMPLHGMNNQPIVKTTNNGYIKLDNHKKFYYLDDQSNPISQFIQPVISVVNYIEKNYNSKSINMVGISGGGWTATVAAALDTRIKNTFSVSGGLPISLLSEHDFGHYELNNKEFYSRFSYLDLFILASVSDESKRKYFQIFNQYDPCCYGGVRWKKYSNEVSFIVKNISNDLFVVLNDDENFDHSISNKSLINIENSID